MTKSINSHQPSAVIGEVGETGQGAVEEAVVRAREAFLEWSEQPAANRGGALAQMADELEERAEELLGRLPAGRWGEPEDLKGAVVFLASSTANYVHGATLPVGGGWLSR